MIRWKKVSRLIIYYKNGLVDWRSNVKFKSSRKTIKVQQYKGHMKYINPKDVSKLEYVTNKRKKKVINNG